jgi:transmembrane sensor
MEEPSSAAQIADFEAWLKADPVHLQAYQELDRVAEVGARRPLPTPIVVRSGETFRGYRPAYAIAAALVLIVGTFWLVRNPAPAFAAVVNNGQAIRMIALRDGSTVTLDTVTSIEVAVDPAARHVRITSGRARFAVRSLAGKALRVTAATSEVTSTSGLFDVAVGREGVRVSAITGDARVAVVASGPSTSPITLSPGQSVHLRNDAAPMIDDRGSDLTWPQAHVAFEDAPLATVIALANRTGRPRISVADGIGHLRVTGVLDIRDTRRLARKLAAALDLMIVERDTDVLLKR